MFFSTKNGFTPAKRAIIVLALVSIIIALAAPLYHNFIDNYRLQSDAPSFVQTFNSAKHDQNFSDSSGFYLC
jgi:Tfp pilus assembly protein FimT